ncbi:SAP domain-containing protein [Deltaproteobacteria bacterium]|nr:SAP domain-containing protein [Deltaproteobacteria bacterium]
MAQSDNLQSLTVAELKVRLKDAGLAVSGKKAELIARLGKSTVLEKPKSVVLVADKFVKSAKKSADGGLPFFLAIKEGGLGDVEIDKWKAASYGMAFFMLIMLIIGLNSMSWYSASMEETEDDGFMGPMTISMEMNVGLSDIQMKMSMLGMEQANEMSLSDCAEGEEEAEEDGEAPISCGALSTAGTINTLCIILSMIAIIILLTFSIGRGFGVFSTGVLDEKSELIEKISWMVAVISINLGSLLYGVIAGFMTDMEEPLEGGLGGMWWIMFLLSLTFAAIVYNEKTMQIFYSLKSKFPSKE